MKRKRWKTVLLIVSCLLLGCLIGLVGVTYSSLGKGFFLARFASVDVSEKMCQETYAHSDGSLMPYRISLPMGYDKAQTYPLVVYLHPMGERGEDNTAHVASNSVMQTLLSNENQAAYPCIIIAPQCPESAVWSQNLEDYWRKNSTAKYTGTGQYMLEYVMGLTQEITERYSVDKNRIYVTGASMGGYGTWAMITEYPEVFAAAVPICGGGDTSQAAKIQSTAVWAFHGTKDRTIDVRESQAMVQAVTAAGNPNVTLTEYPGEDHWSWELAYREAELFPWLFAQHK